MIKVLITGAEGFVGQHLLECLDKDYFIIALSLNSLIPESENIKSEMGDILDQNFLDEVIKKYQPDAVVHLAGIAQTWNQPPDLLFSVNLNGTLNLYRSIIKIGSGYSPKILFISSAEVYGNMSDSHGLINEDFPLNPINYYASSKVASDRLSYQLSQSDKLNIAILRPFAHIGPGQKMGFFVPDIASQIVHAEKEGKGQVKVGNLGAVRDYTDVRDVVRAYKLLIEADFQSGEVFNVCSGKGIKMKELLDMMVKEAKIDIKIAQDTDKFRENEVKVKVGDNKKLKALINWDMEISIDQTIKDTLEYWRSQ